MHVCIISVVCKTTAYIYVVKFAYRKWIPYWCSCCWCLCLLMLFDHRNCIPFVTFGRKFIALLTIFYFMLITDNKYCYCNKTWELLWIIFTLVVLILTYAISVSFYTLKEICHLSCCISFDFYVLYNIMSLFRSYCPLFTALQS